MTAWRLLAWPALPYRTFSRNPAARTHVCAIRAALAGLVQTSIDAPNASLPRCGGNLGPLSLRCPPSASSAPRSSLLRIMADRTGQDCAKLLSQRTDAKRALDFIQGKFKLRYYARFACLRRRREARVRAPSLKSFSTALSAPGQQSSVRPAAPAYY